MLISSALFAVFTLILYLAFAILVALAVYFVIRRTRGLGGKDTAEILDQLKETNRLLEQLIAAQRR